MQCYLLGEFSEASPSKHWHLFAAQLQCQFQATSCHASLASVMGSGLQMVLPSREFIRSWLSLSLHAVCIQFVVQRLLIPGGIVCRHWQVTICNDASISSLLTL